MNISSNPALQAGGSVKTEKPGAITRSGVEDSAKSEKAQKSIEEFEGLFMSMMIKQLRETDSGEGFFPGDHSDTYGGMFDMFMGQHLAESSDTGLEKLFNSAGALKQLEEHAKPSLTMDRRSKGLEEYRNEQFRSAGAINPAAS